MKKTLILVLTVVAIIACMAMPVVATDFSPGQYSIRTQYQGSTLCDQGIGSCMTEGRIRLRMYIVDSGLRTPRGIVTYNFNSSRLTRRNVKSGWVDHRFKCTVVKLIRW